MRRGLPASQAGREIVDKCQGRVTSVDRPIRSRLQLAFLGALVFAAGCGHPTTHLGAVGDTSATSDRPTNPTPSTWSLAQQGTDAGVKWQVFVGDTANGFRCISIELDPKPGSPLQQTGSTPVDARGNPIPPPPTPGVGPSYRHSDGCAPGPSLTNGRSQPLYTLQADQSGGTGNYHYAVGTAVETIAQINVEFSDHTVKPIPTHNGTFMVIYPSNETLSGLNPVVPKFPNLRCSIISEATPPVGGLPAFTTYADGGCTGYTFPVP